MLTRIAEARSMWRGSSDAGAGQRPRAMARFQKAQAELSEDAGSVCWWSPGNYPTSRRTRISRDHGRSWRHREPPHHGHA